MDTPMVDHDQLLAWRQVAGEARKIGPEAARQAVDVLHHAFHDDPIMLWMLRPGAAFDSARRHLIDVVVGRRTVPLGATWLACDGQGQGLACAAFEPPTVAGRKLALGESLSLAPAMIRAAGLARLPRLLASIAALERHHPTHEPHFYLFFLGVDPRAQGKGLGSKILEAALAEVDAQGLPCYLENSKDRNTPFYRRHGFVPGEAFRARADAPPLLPMWRKAGKG